MFSPFPREALERPIIHRFREQVAAHPHRPAVEWDGTTLEYAELAGRASRVAARVRAGAGEEPAAVALLLPQGIDLIVAMLGVLEAGDWYVPLDPAESPERLREQIARAEARLVLASAPTKAAAIAGADSACAVARVDAPNELGAVAPVAMRQDPGLLAYVYFTSGTSGTPKGVMDTHRNVLHNVLRYTNALRLCADDRLTLVQAAHFSGAVSNVFGALLNGACVLPYDVSRDGAGAPLARWVRRTRPTVFHSVPSLFRSLCVPGMHFDSVRTVRLEGDSGAPADAERFAAHFAPGSVLVHGLGATETGISRQFFLEHGERVAGDVLPVGRAVADVEVDVRDTAGKVLASGEAGEIVVRSRWLSPGYWRDPERTAAVFRQDAADPGRREYHTGDLGRLREDGCLDHLGRMDLQTKVRGEWVDVAAVETALATVPGVAECAVAALRGEGDEIGLAAFVVIVAGAAPPTMRDLRRAVSAKGPARAVPARGYAIEHLPLGPHAKLDRRALQPGLGIPLPEGGGGTAPRDALESELTLIWARELGGEAPGIDEAFVELGGDSLKAAQVASAIERQFGVALPHGVLAEAPTIAALAARIREHDPSVRERPKSTLVPIRVTGSGAPLFCVHDFESDAFLFSPLARRLGADQPLYGLRFPAGGAAHAVPRSVEELAALYLADIARVSPRVPYRLAGFCFGGVVAMEMARQLRSRGEGVAQLALLNVTAYDFTALVSPAARKRFRHHWPARLRYLRGKPDAVRWIARRLRSMLEVLVWRAWLPIRLAGAGAKHAASPALVRAASREAFRRYLPRPHDGELSLFLADETLHLYADDPAEAWAGLASGEVEIRRLPRDGYAMLSEPDVEVLAVWLDLPRAAAMARPTGAA